MLCVALCFGLFFLCGDFLFHLERPATKKTKQKAYFVCTFADAVQRGKKAALCAHVALPEEAQAGGGRGSLLLPTLACQTGRLGELVLRQISLPIN